MGALFGVLLSALAHHHAVLPIPLSLEDFMSRPAPPLVDMCRVYYSDRDVRGCLISNFPSVTFMQMEPNGGHDKSAMGALPVDDATGMTNPGEIPTTIDERLPCRKVPKGTAKSKLGAFFLFDDSVGAPFYCEEI